MIYIKEVDDWITVWKDGERVWGNHSCRLTEGLDALGIEYKGEYREFSEIEDGDAQMWLDSPPSEVVE